MPTTIVSRPSRFGIHGGTVLETAHTIAQLVKDVTEIANVPFASPVAALVLSLLEIAKDNADSNDASVRLATTAATYLIQLKPILDPQDSTYNSDIPPELRFRLDRFHYSLINLKDYLETTQKRTFSQRIFRKDKYTSDLQEREKALQDSYNALQMWTNISTYTLVRKAAKDADTDGIPRFDQAQVVLKGTLKANGGFFSKLQPGELRANGDRQRVLVKRFANKTERDSEAKKWRKLWHANLPQLAGCSSDRSTMQFILFHDVDLTSQHIAETRSLAAFLLDFSRSHDVFPLADKIVDFMNDAISAVRHMQVMLMYDEAETLDLAMKTTFTIGFDGRIVVTPPPQDSAEMFIKGSYSVLLVPYTIYGSLFPTIGISEASMRRYFERLDGVPTHATLAKVLDDEQLEKWAALEGIRTQIRALPDGYEKPQQYVMPETQCASANYSADIEPGNFGVLVPGEGQEYAFRRVGNSAANNSALFEYQSRRWLSDGDLEDFEVVCEQPETWRLDRLTDSCMLHHRHFQQLTNEVHQLKQFLQSSAPKDCDVDKLVFVVGTYHSRTYLCDIKPELMAGESQVSDIYACFPHSSAGELRFSHCAPGACPDSCDHLLDSRISIEKYADYFHIEYVKVPVQRHSARLEAFVEDRVV